MYTQYMYMYTDSFTVLHFDIRRVYIFHEYHKEELGDAKQLHTPPTFIVLY